MIRRDRQYWARLRKDGRSALAVGSALIACLVALLCAMGLLIESGSSHASRQIGLDEVRSDVEKHQCRSKGEHENTCRDQTSIA